MTNSVGIAYHQASGNGQSVKDGAHTKRLGPGMAVRGGIASAHDGQARPHRRAQLPGRQGRTLQGLPHGRLLAGAVWSTSWAPASRASTCRSSPIRAAGACIAFVDAGLALAAKYDIRPEDVESILIQCGEGTYGLLGSPLEVKAQPRNPVDSQFSIVWGVATALARHRVTLDDFTGTPSRAPTSWASRRRPTCRSSTTSTAATRASSRPA